MAKKILVVDDEEIIIKSLRKLLTKQGYEVTVAQSGLEAVEHVKTRDFDLIVLDVRMPQINGIDTVKKIREHRKEQGKEKIPEILITGYADEEKYKNAVELKVAQYIYKPFDTTEFLDVVKDNLGEE